MPIYRGLACSLVICLSRSTMAVSGDMPIYVRILGDDRFHWYVIEQKEKSSSSSSSSDHDELPCNSTTDRVKRLTFADSSFDWSYTNAVYGNNLVVLNSKIILLGGDERISEARTGTPGYDKYIGYQHLDMGSPGKLGNWEVGGGSVIDKQDGGAAMGHDGTIYSVGNTLYKFTPDMNGGLQYKSKKLPPPKIDCSSDYYSHSLLALSNKKLITYTNRGGGKNGEANVMLSYDLELDKWEKESLHNDFEGFWSPGVLLYDDNYLFSFGSQAPEAGFLCEEVPGIYVFDMKRRQWLSKPVQGLRTDDTVLPSRYKSSLDPDWGGHLRLYSPYLFQIGKGEERKLKFALLWNEHNSLSCRITLVWAKFILNFDDEDQEAPFYATSVSTGSCELDEDTFELLNCAARI